MNTKSLIPLVAGLVVAGLAIKLGTDALKKAKGSQEIQTTEIWTASTDILRGRSITAEMLAPRTVPAKNVPTGAFTNKDELVGRVVKSTRLVGDVLKETALLAPGASAGLPVPHGYRAVAVKIDESSGVDYHLEPGSHVDVIAYFRVRKDGKQETIARSILENVKVGAVGQKISADMAPQGEESAANGRPVRAVTLFVKPDQVPTLHLAEQTGKLKLAMRNSTDNVPRKVHQQINEDQMLFPGRQTADKDNQTGASQGGWLARLFSKPETPKDSEESVSFERSEPIAAAEKPEVRVPVHTMWVINGNDRVKLAWYSMNDTEPVEIVDDGPNMFSESEYRTPGAVPMPKEIRTQTPPTREAVPEASEGQPQRMPQESLE